MQLLKVAKKDVFWSRGRGRISASGPPDAKKSTVAAEKRTPSFLTLRARKLHSWTVAFPRSARSILQKKNRREPSGWCFPRVSVTCYPGNRPSGYSSSSSHAPDRSGQKSRLPESPRFLQLTVKKQRAKKRPETPGARLHLGVAAGSFRNSCWSLGGGGGGARLVPFPTAREGLRARERVRLLGGGRRGAGPLHSSLYLLPGLLFSA